MVVLEGVLTPVARPVKFRRRAVAQAHAKEKPIAVLTSDLGISESCLRRWVSIADVDEGAKENQLRRPADPCRVAPRTAAAVRQEARRPADADRRHCAAVVDVFSRRVVGWAIAGPIHSELVVDALDMARWRRKPEPGTWFIATAAVASRGLV